MKKKEGIGSYFHFEALEDLKISAVNIDFDYKLFYTGRHALLYILNEISGSRTISKIWFPNYYCQHTLAWIKKSYQNIGIYELNPFEFGNDVIDTTQFASPNEVVIVNNYWGLSSMLTKKNENAPVIIEDHSHGWLSQACLNSKADYCFVSLRKSLPIPLGGLYWKPKVSTNVNTPDFEEDATFYKIWEDMLNAMTLKLKFIHGDKTIKSSTYLPLFYEVEEALNVYTKFAKLTDAHKIFIESYLSLDIKKIKNKNLDVLYTGLKDTQYFKIIKRENYTAFGFLLLLKNKAVFLDLKAYLVANGIYPSTLWPDNTIDYEWQYFLNIHVDFRYNKQDLNHIIRILKKWHLETN